MPRGFLVKRSRKTCGSYRIPSDESASSLPFPSVRGVLGPFTPTLLAHSALGATDLEQPHQAPHAHEGLTQAASDLSTLKMPCRPEQTGHWNQLPYCPVKPVGLDMTRTFFKRYLSSPPSAESYPVATSLASMEKLLTQQSPFLPADASLHARAGSRDTPRAKPPCKKNKATRRLNFADEVTTSPVLGLKIKAEDPERKSRSPPVKRPPLGEFICQLCKEQYPDPFALAQHKCSRIVRVEYRCPECEKIFSCPANLASHRRWHKPRGLPSDGLAGKKLHMALEGKENSRRVLLPVQEPQSSRVQHLHPGDKLSGQHLHPGDKLSGQHLHPGDKLSDQHLHPGDKLSDQHLHPGDKLSGQHLHPGDKLSGQHLHPGDKLSGQHLHPGDKLSDQHLHPGDSSHLKLPDQHLHPGDSSHLKLPDQHLHPGDSSCHSRDSQRSMPLTPGEDEDNDEEEEDAFDCPYCNKRFRRLAYLRKHLITHQPFHPLERAQLSFPCSLCGIHFPTLDIIDKHRLWHAVREELLIPLGQEEPLVAVGGQQIFPCELCPTAFFSSPGLTLHMSKCHSPGGGQDLPHQSPLGPVC